eukprot:Unigene12088_Nuclearia_a/m.36768 Unigene12088_Nuclearia_a/g.36768  ORF Unigene12088_Nuclearia_a/g.36768 Unigene12088_Nuclearia_a/m.36768 type:complete len:170 (-) Unigene12088_Nuclearia_a:505-1014(-)
MASFEPSQATQIAGQERASPDGAEHDDEDARPPDAPWARLVQFQPARRYDLRGDEPLVIGRHANSTIAVQHPQVSNKHCNVRRKALLKTFSCFIEARRRRQRRGRARSARRLTCGARTCRTRRPTGRSSTDGACIKTRRSSCRTRRSSRSSAPGPSPSSSRSASCFTTS